MARRIRGQGDPELQQVVDALAGYESRHPRADIEAYRQSNVSIRLRVIDPDFAGVSRADRHDLLWDQFESLPEEIQSQISVLLPLTPEEARVSFANQEFDNPIPSRL